MKLLSLFLSLFCFFFLEAKTVYIVHIGGIDSGKYFYDPNAFRDECGKPYCELREALEKEGYKVGFTYDASNLRDVAAIISFNDASKEIVRNLVRYPKEKALLFITEPPVVLPDLYRQNLLSHFGRVYVMFDNLVDNVNFFKFYYPQPRLKMIENVPDFSEKKLCTLINSNKDFSHPNALYGERRNVIQYYTDHHLGEFDLYGCDWNGYKAWRGTIPQKWEVLKNYKFSFCYDNMKNQRGYITEKIIDSFVGGCVPVYLGAENITDYIPKECFIDRRDFHSDDAVYHFLKSIDQETYKGYLQAIQSYLASEQAKVFSSEHFVETILKEVRRVSGN